MQTLCVGQKITVFENNENVSKEIEKIIKKKTGFKPRFVFLINVSEIEECTIFFTDKSFINAKIL